MEDRNNKMTQFYTENKYLEQNPDIESGISWKVEKIKPMIDSVVNDFLQNHSKDDDFTIMDIGGGTGAILARITDYIREEYSIKVKKYILDLSPEGLSVQKNNNPDILKIFQEDISVPSPNIKDKEINLTMMIDVIEHIPHPEDALKELHRITEYAIFKTPLENNMYCNTRSVLDKNYRQKQVETIGHINYFSSKQLNTLLSEHCGEVIDEYYTDCYSYFLSAPEYKSINIKLFNMVGHLVHMINPSLAALLFTDYKMSLIKCS
ncbi:methyltransferase domain-containing protein [Candidatus Margulisiibacteriota bacterium]